MIRPLDLQNTLLQSMQGAGAVQRAEDGPRLAAQAAQANFAAQVTHRDETVAPASEAHGNRVDARSGGRGSHGGDRNRRRTIFEAVADDASVDIEDAHFIDVTA